MEACETPGDRNNQQVAMDLYHPQRKGEDAGRFEVVATELFAPHDFEVFSVETGKRVAVVEVKCRLTYSMAFLIREGVLLCRDKFVPFLVALDQGVKAVVLIACKDGFLAYDLKGAVVKISAEPMGRTDRGRSRDLKYELLLIEPSEQLPYTEAEQAEWARAGVKVSVARSRQSATR